jgi:hypothetical protein
MRTILGRSDLLYHFDRKFTNSEKLLAEMADKFSFLSSSDLKQGLFFWPLRVTELTVEMVQYPVYPQALAAETARF